MELKPGDVVMLKSGGHPITVAEVNEESVECVWMGIDGDLFRETLPAAVLEAANPEDEEEDEEDEDDEGEEEDDDEEAEEDDDDRRKGKVA